jgi:hypothetical protein
VIGLLKLFWEAVVGCLGVVAVGQAATRSTRGLHVVTETLAGSGLRSNGFVIPLAYDILILKLETVFLFGV